MHLITKIINASLALKARINPNNGKIKKKKNTEEKNSQELLSNRSHLHNNKSAIEIASRIEDLNEMKVAEIMLPRIDIKSIPFSTSLPDLKNIFTKTGFSKIPVYKEDLDEMLGFVHVKSILPFLDQEQSFSLTKILEPFVYIPKSLKVIDLFVKMIENKADMAIVLDEYGGIEGLVTIECIVKRLVTEISGREELQEGREESIRKVEPNVYIINAKTLITKVEKELGELPFLSEEEGEYETLAGFIFSYLNRVPEKGEKFVHHSGVIIEIMDASPRKINFIKVTLPYEHIKDGHYLAHRKVVENKE